jgi:hypothetical protein
MAKQLSKTGILDGQLATAAQVTQSIDALTGADGYDITISGSLTVTGSTDLNGNLAITGFPNVSASLAASGVGNGFPFTGSAEITGSLNIVGNITASGNISSSGDIFANDITLEANGISDKPNVILQRGAIQGITLEMGSGGNDNGLLRVNNTSGLPMIRLEGGGNSFFSQSLNVGVPYSYPEPVGGTFTVRGTISSSGAINTLSDITSSGNIVFAGNISGSGTNSSYFGDEYNAHGGDGNSGFTLLSLGNKPSIFASGTSVFVGNSANTTQTGINLVGQVTASGNISASGDIIGNNGSFSTSVTTPEISGNTEITGDLQVVNITATHITASGHGLFQAGKPIITHTTHLSASISQAGFYNIVGGQFTCSITISSAPVGAEYEFFQTSSAGNFFFHTGSGITLISKNNSLRLAQQGSSAVLKKVATDTFHLMGDLT